MLATEKLLTDILAYLKATLPGLGGGSGSNVTIVAPNPLPVSGSVTAAITDAVEGTTADVPDTNLEDATPKTVISLLKGIKNFLRTIATAVGDGVGTSVPTRPTNNVMQFNYTATDNAAHDLLAAAGGSLRWNLTDILVTNGHASVSTLVTIQDDTGAVVCLGYAAFGGGGFSHNFSGAPMTGANKKLQVICGTTGASVYVCGTAYAEA